jgi:tetratricopeptide (TPR) repeat protein
VLERARVNLLLDEIRLGEEAQRVDPSTAARSGRMLGAGNLIQGMLQGGGDQLRLQAMVLRVPGDTVGRNPLSESGALNNIFDMEKRVALSTYERLGIQLTAAERERVMRMATTNVQALLAFGYGLEAQDAGRYAEAAEHFARATQLDPNFDAARTNLNASIGLQRAAAAPPAELGRMSVLETGPVLEWQRWQRAFDAIEMFVPVPVYRDPAAEALGTEGLGRGGTIDIIIRRPGGTP